MPGFYNKEIILKLATYRQNGFLLTSKLLFFLPKGLSTPALGFYMYKTFIFIYQDHVSVERLKVLVLKWEPL